MLDPRVMQQLSEAQATTDKNLESARAMQARAQAIACLAFEPEKTYNISRLENLQTKAAEFLEAAFDKEIQLLKAEAQEAVEGLRIAEMLRGRQ